MHGPRLAMEIPNGSRRRRRLDIISSAAIRLACVHQTAIESGEMHSVALA